MSLPHHVDCCCKSYKNCLSSQPTLSSFSILSQLSFVLPEKIRFSRTISARFHFSDHMIKLSLVLRCQACKLSSLLSRTSQYGPILSISTLKGKTLTFYHVRYAQRRAANLSCRIPRTLQVSVPSHSNTAQGKQTTACPHCLDVLTT